MENLLDSTKIGNETWKTAVRAYDFDETNSKRFIGNVGTKLSVLKPGIDFWKDVLPSLGKPFHKLSKDYATKNIFVINAINAQGNKTTVQQDDDNDEIGLFNSIKTLHEVIAKEENLTGIESYSLEQNPAMVSISSTYADGAPHENATFQIRNQGKGLDNAILEINKAKFIALIELLRLDAEQSHLISLLENKLKGLDVTKIPVRPSGTRAAPAPADMRTIGSENPTPAMERHNGILDQLFNLRKDGKCDEAISLCQTELRSEDCQTDPRLIANLQYELGVTLHKKGGDAEAAAIGPFQEALLSKDFQKEFPGRCWLGTETLAVIQENLGRYDRAADTYQNLAESGLITNNAELARIHDNVGYLFARAGDDENAAEADRNIFNKKAAEAFLMAFRSDDYPDSKGAGMRLSFIQSRMEKDLDAVATNQELEERGDFTSPAELAQLAAIHADTGELYANVGENEKAIEWLQKAYDSDDYRELLNTNWMSAGKLLSSLQRAMKKYVDAAATNQKLAEKGEFTDPAALGEIYADIGDLFELAWRDEKAVEADRKAFCEKAIVWSQKAFGSDDFRNLRQTDWKDAGKRISFMQGQLKQDAAATATGQELAEKGKFTNPEEVADLAIIHANIGNSLVNEGKNEKAIYWLQKAFDSDHHRDLRHASWKNTGKRLSLLQGQLKQDAAAAATDHELAEKGKFTNPEEVAELAAIHANIGYSRAKEGMKSEAMGWYQEAFNSRDFRDLRYADWQGTGKRLFSLQSKAKEYDAAVATNRKRLRYFKFIDAEALADNAEINADIGYVLAKAGEVEQDEGKDDTKTGEAIESLRSAFGSDFYRESRHSGWKKAGKLLSYLQRKTKQYDAAVATNLKLAEKGKFTTPAELADVAAIHAEIDELRAKKEEGRSSSSESPPVSSRDPIPETPGSPTQEASTPSQRGAEATFIDAPQGIYYDHNPFPDQELTIGLQDLGRLFFRGGNPREIPPQREPDSGGSSAGSGDDYIDGAAAIRRESAEATERLKRDPRSAEHLAALRASRPPIQSVPPPLPPRPQPSSPGPSTTSQSHGRE